MIILKGLPACGKTTYAKEYIEKNPNTMRVNRDSLRKMLFFSEFTPKREKTVVSLGKEFVRLIAGNGYDVMIDDTNLNPEIEEMWKEIGESLKMEVEVYMVEEAISLERLIIRDARRDESVGSHVIKNMAFRYKMYGYGLTPVIICDIDGTLCDITHRLHYVQGEQKDWDGFFSQMHKDTPRLEIINQVKKFINKGFEVVFVSGRNEKYREFTERWLLEHDLWAMRTILLMRPEHDRRPDDLVKESIYQQYLANKDVCLAIDDRPRILRVWEKHGIQVSDVGPGIEF